MEEGRVFDQGLEFQYRQAQSDLDQANRALEMSAWQTAVENPFNVAAMNMLSGQNVFAPQATPTDAFQQALGPQQGNVQRYNDQGQLVTMTDPELEQMQQRMLANPDRPMFSGQGFDTPVTREQFVMAYNQLLQRGMSPTDAATALGMGPDGLRKMQELTTPGVRPRTGEVFLRPWESVPLLERLVLLRLELVDLPLLLQHLELRSKVLLCNKA